jgi:hypothetical protein
MSTIEIKKSLHNYINIADEQFLKAIYALMQYDLSKDGFELTNEQKKILDARRINHKNGKSKSYTWAEVKQRAKAALDK